MYYERYMPVETHYEVCGNDPGDEVEFELPYEPKTVIAQVRDSSGNIEFDNIQATIDEKVVTVKETDSGFSEDDVVSIIAFK